MMPLFSKESSSHNSRIIVFDFGKVIGETDKELMTKRLKDELHVSSKKAEKIAEFIRCPGASKGKGNNFLRQLENTTGEHLPKGWVYDLEEVKFTLGFREVPGMKELISELRSKGYKLAILSNVTKKRAAIYRRKGFYEGFRPVVLSCDVGVKKPRKKIFAKLLHKLKKPAKKCIFIDDKACNIRVAKSLGFDAIQFKSAKKLRASLRRRHIDI
jgi:HAD superfamily hydrolase (TIGR01509 family)